MDNWEGTGIENADELTLPAQLDWSISDNYYLNNRLIYLSNVDCEVKDALREHKEPFSSKEEIERFINDFKEDR